MRTELSVPITSRNGADALAALLEDALLETVPDQKFASSANGDSPGWEIIAVDNGSTDQTGRGTAPQAKLIRQYLQRKNGPEGAANAPRRKHVPKLFQPA